MDTALNNVGTQNATPLQSANPPPPTQFGFTPVGFVEQPKSTPISLTAGFARVVPSISAPSHTPSNGQSAIPLPTNPFLQTHPRPASTYINPSDQSCSEALSNAMNALGTTHSNPVIPPYTTNLLLQRNTSIQSPTNALSNLVGISSFVQPSYGQPVGTQASFGPPKYIPIATIPAFTISSIPQKNVDSFSQYTNPPPPPASMHPLWQPGPSFAESRWWTQPVTPALFENYSDTRPVLPMAPPLPPRPFVIEPLPSQKEWWDAASKTSSTQRFYARELEVSTRKSKKRRRYAGEEEDISEYRVRLCSLIMSCQYLTIDFIAASRWYNQAC